MLKQKMLQTDAEKDEKDTGIWENLKPNIYERR